ncbi:hypothetical protein HR11_10105 [Porphyromonas macacae]|nr:hypothetical protein HR11_10105 [Porphyromonas macacae]
MKKRFLSGILFPRIGFALCKHLKHLHIKKLPVYAEMEILLYDLFVVYMGGKNHIHEELLMYMK